MKLKHSILFVLPLAISASCTVDTTQFQFNPEIEAPDPQENDSMTSERSGIILELGSTELEEEIQVINFP